MTGNYRQIWKSKMVKIRAKNGICGVQCKTNSKLKKILKKIKLGQQNIKFKGIFLNVGSCAHDYQDILS